MSSFASDNGKKAALPEHEVHDFWYYNSIFDNADVKKNTTKTVGVNERMRLGYRKDWFNVGLSGSVNYHHSKSALQNSSNMDTWHYDYGANVHFDFDWGLSVSSDIRMSSRRGYSDASMNTNELLWNAQISHSFLKERAATISLQFYDILHNQSNVSRVVNAMSRRDSWTNAINSYCMLHFIYRLNIFSGQKGASHKGGGKGMRSGGPKGKKK